jgi:hypothetical protein
VLGSHALPPSWPPQCSCVVIESSFDPGERLQPPGSLWFSIIFINNLVDDLNKDNTDPVVIGDTSVNILLYADDIVLLSQSKEGLQNSLNLLHDVRKFYFAYGFCIH